MSSVFKDISLWQVNGRPFVKLEVIGSGGSSKVYRVMAPNLTIHALKYVKLDIADAHTKVIDSVNETVNPPQIFTCSNQTNIIVPLQEMYLNEIDLLERLRDQENIVTLIDYEVKSGTFFKCCAISLTSVEDLIIVFRYRCFIYGAGTWRA